MIQRDGEVQESAQKSAKRAIERCAVRVRDDGKSDSLEDQSFTERRTLHKSWNHDGRARAHSVGTVGVAKELTDEAGRDVARHEASLTS